ncbi:MAG: hypothetical protein LBU65_14815 [Planctomycetaceae bacterium]|jgi:hypothetical protein|nr:hypothetical protein [Planctomycetaceae bacterium]
MCRYFFCTLFVLFGAVAFGQDGAAKAVRFALLDADGSELKLVDETESFKLKDVNVSVTVKADKTTATYRVESALLADGKLGVGFEFANERHLPVAATGGKPVSFALQYSKAAVKWSGNSTLVVPKPRKKLDITNAEYGANDKWIDVAPIVNKYLVGDQLINFLPGNDLFGDPINGVVKTFELTYSIGDDEEIKSFAERQAVTIQYAPRDRYFRLFPKSEKFIEIEFKLTGK